MNLQIPLKDLSQLFAILPEIFFSTKKLIFTLSDEDLIIYSEDPDETKYRLTVLRFSLNSLISPLAKPLAFQFMARQKNEKEIETLVHVIQKALKALEKEMPKKKGESQIITMVLPGDMKILEIQYGYFSLKVGVILIEAKPLPQIEVKSGYDFSISFDKLQLGQLFKFISQTGLDFWIEFAEDKCRITCFHECDTSIFEIALSKKTSQVIGPFQYNMMYVGNVIKTLVAIKSGKDITLSFGSSGPNPLKIEYATEELGIHIESYIAPMVKNDFYGALIKIPPFLASQTSEIELWLSQEQFRNFCERLIAPALLLSSGAKFEFFSEGSKQNLESLKKAILHV